MKILLTAGIIEYRIHKTAPRRIHAKTRDASRQIALERLELPTFGLGNRCSVQLSYRAKIVYESGLRASERRVHRKNERVQEFVQARSRAHLLTPIK
jgi:hypothetical protein